MSSVGLRLIPTDFDPTTHDFLNSPFVDYQGSHTRYEDQLPYITHVFGTDFNQLRQRVTSLRFNIHSDLAVKENQIRIREQHQKMRIAQATQSSFFGNLVSGVKGLWSSTLNQSSSLESPDEALASCYKEQDRLLTESIRLGRVCSSFSQAEEFRGQFLRNDGCSQIIRTMFKFEHRISIPGLFSHDTLCLSGKIHGIKCLNDKFVQVIESVGKEIYAFCWGGGQTGL